MSSHLIPPERAKLLGPHLAAVDQAQQVLIKLQKDTLALAIYLVGIPEPFKVEDFRLTFNEADVLLVDMSLIEDDAAPIE